MVLEQILEFRSTSGFPTQSLASNTRQMRRRLRFPRRSATLMSVAKPRLQDELHMRVDIINPPEFPTATPAIKARTGGRERR
jgi:hypothetical protein